MKVNLNVPERIVILSDLLPEAGSYTTFKLILDTKAALSFTEDEHAAYALVQHEDGRVTWDVDKDEGRDFEFGGVVAGLIASALGKLDKDEKLEVRHMSLYEKFCQ